MKRNGLPIVIVTAATLALAACASSAHSASLNGAGAPAMTAVPTPGATGAPQVPRVSGRVAAITGKTAQVQGTNQQTAVTWTSATRFMDQVAASASLLKVGTCVMARAARPVSDSPGATTPAPEPSTTPPSPGTVRAIAAATVELFPLQNGTCALGFGGRGNAPSGGPTGTRRARPDDGAFPGRPGFARVALGRVTSLGPGGFTVMPTLRAGAAAPVTVTYSSATTFTRLTTASATAMKVGICVSAQGTMDDTGALTATSIAMSPPSADGCVAGFGGRGPGGGTNEGRPNGGDGIPSTGAVANA